MGCFGYICNKCGLSVRDGEKAVLRHIRHGEILGETTGVYNSYGGVYEDDVFRSRKKDEKSTINNHEEICSSTFGLRDSVERYCSGITSKEYKGVEVDLLDFTEMLAKENNIIPATLEETVNRTSTKEQREFLSCAIKQFSDLPEWKEEFTPKSGVVAFHAKCYHSLKDTPEDEALRRKPSESDPDQSWGTPRKRFL